MTGSRLLPLIGIILLALLAGCQRTSDDPVNAISALPAARVTTAPVSSEWIPLYQPLPGTVQAIDRATVAAQTMAQVLTADLALGQAVRAGETLVELDPAVLTAQADQARAALELTTRNHEREAKLLAQGASTGETVRTLADQQRIAAAQLAAATAQLAYTRVRAPFDGVITQRLVEPGDMAAPGTPLFALEGARLEANVYVPEALAPGAAALTPFPVEIGDTLVVAPMREASAASDPLTRTRQVRLALPDDAPAHTGQFVRVRWPRTGATQLTIPASAVSRFGQIDRVFVATDGHARMRLVRIGDLNSDRVTVIAGLSLDEAVIVDPPDALRDGQAIVVTTR